MTKASFVEHALESAFEKVGKLVGRHPLRSIVLSCLLMAAIGPFALTREPEVRPDRLWVPDTALALEQQAKVEEEWPSRIAPSVLTGFCGDDCDVLDHFAEWETLINQLNAHEIDGDKEAELFGIPAGEEKAQFNGKWTYYGDDSSGSICYEFAEGVCGATSILSAVPQSMRGTKQQILEALNTYDQAGLNMPVTYSDGSTGFKSFELSRILGGIQRDATTNEITGARLYADTWLHDYRNVQVGDSARDPVVYEWEAQAICAAGMLESHPERDDECKPHRGELDVKGYFVRTFNDEFGSALNSDIGSLVIAINLTSVYIIFFLGKKDVVHGGITLACFALLVVGGGVGVSFGLGGIAQIKTNPLLNNIPFLLLGLGVDAAFVVKGEFVVHLEQATQDHAKAKATGETGDVVSADSDRGVSEKRVAPAEKKSQPPQQISAPGVNAARAHLQMSAEEYNELLIEVASRASKSGGISMLVSSFTDALAFLIGSSTVVPALRAFCLYAFFGVSAAFIFVMTVFLPALVLNARRTHQNRLDFLCCVKASAVHEADAPQGCCNPCFSWLRGMTTFKHKARTLPELYERAKVNPHSLPESYSVAPCFYPDGALERTLYRVYEMIIPSLFARLAILLAWGACLAFGVIGLYEMKTDYDYFWMVPPDAYVHDALERMSTYIGSSEVTIGVYIDDKDLNNEAQLQKLAALLEGDNRMVGVAKDGASYWYSSWGGSLPGESVDEAHQRLYLWLGAAGSEFDGRVKWVNDECNVERNPIDVGTLLTTMFAMGVDVSAATGMPATTLYSMNATTLNDTLAQAGILAQAPAQLTAQLSAMALSEQEQVRRTCAVDGISSFKVDFTLSAEVRRGDGSEKYEDMRTMRREVLDAMETDDELKAFPYVTSFVFWEEFGIIPVELARNLIVCGAVIGVLIFAMVPQFRAALCCLIAIASTVAQVGGFLHYWGITLGSIVTVFFLIVVGLAVDACVHIAHFFVLMKGTEEKKMSAVDRATGAAMRIGPSVCHALMSTFMAVIVLSQTESWVFQVFFKTLLLQVVFSFFNGLFVLPALLSLLGGPR